MSGTKSMSIVSYSGLGDLERVDKPRKCGLCGAYIEPEEWHIRSYHYPEGQKRRSPFTSCMPCSDVIKWAAAGGYEEGGLVNSWTANGWAFACEVQPSRPEHYRAQSAAKAYRERREKQLADEWERGRKGADRGNAG